MEGRTHYHSIIKTIRGRVFLYEDSDRLLFLGILRRFIEKYEITLVEFVLMDNHVHLLHTAQSKEQALLFVSEMQQNFSYWYNRFHATHDPLFVPAKIYPKYREDLITKCALYILQNPMVAARDSYPHPKDYKWSSYRFHYDFMGNGASPAAPLTDSSQIIKANYMAKIINGSKSVYKNVCPPVREVNKFNNLKLNDLVDVNTFEMDRLYTPDEFEIAAQKFIVTFQEEYAQELEQRKKRYLSKHKEAITRVSRHLVAELAGRDYNKLTKEEKTELISNLLSYRKTSVIQVVMLLDEDKKFVAKIHKSLKYK